MQCMCQTTMKTGYKSEALFGPLNRKVNLLAVDTAHVNNKPQLSNKTVMRCYHHHYCLRRLQLNQDKGWLIFLGSLHIQSKSAF